MPKETRIIDYALIAVGTAFGISDIESLLGIVILVFEIVWIIAKLVLKIYEHVKNKDVKSAVEDIKEATDELEDIKKTIEDEKDGDK